MKHVKPRVACIVLNWNAPWKTIDCLNSISKGTVKPETIYVVDNNSSDNSVNIIKNAFFYNKKNCKNINHFGSSLKFIASKRNLGYAGGNNLAIREILKDFQINFIWILNNDTLVSENTLQEMTQSALANYNAGFLGALILYKDSNIIQCYGGCKYFSKLGVSKLLYKNRPLDKLPKICTNPDYIMGANILVKREVIDQYGLLSEDYFMYSEDIEWQLRARARWGLAVTNKTHIYHDTKESRKKRSQTYYYYKNRSTIFHVKKQHGIFWALMSALVHTPIILLDKPKFRSLIKAFAGLFSGLLSQVRNSEKRGL